MMKKNERFTKILDLLTENEKVEVTTLSNLLQVSQVTIRKDLDELEENGLIQRSHGFAQRIQTDNIGGRLAWHYEEKKKIAEKAIELIQDGDTVMIESGSCCALLAALLTQKRKNITIITNSAYIAQSIEKSSFQTILLGGIYQSNSQCLVGPMIATTASMFHVKYFFIGTDGYSTQTGFTNKDQLRAQAVRDMEKSCDHVVVLTESDKFHTVGTVPLLTSKLDIVVTDEAIPSEVLNHLIESNITVYQESI